MPFYRIQCDLHLSFVNLKTFWCNKNPIYYGFKRSPYESFSNFKLAAVTIIPFKCFAYAIYHISKNLNIMIEHFISILCFSILTNMSMSPPQLRQIISFRNRKTHISWCPRFNDQIDFNISCKMSFTRYFLAVNRSWTNWSQLVPFILCFSAT